MKSLGYQWSPERKNWVRGNPMRRTLECRSGGRVLRLVGDECPPVTEALKRLEQVLVSAREQAFNEKGVKGSTFPSVVDKNSLDSPLAPYIWFALQVSALATMITVIHPDLGVDASTSPAVALLTVSAGITAGPVLAAIRRMRWTLQVGAEDADGAVERVLADAALGSHALPAPWDWRTSSKEWCTFAVAAETLASVNVMLLLHGFVQADLTALYSETTGSDFMAAGYALMVVVSCTALLTAATVRPPVDGIDAENAAVRRAARSAKVYFTWNSGFGTDAVADSVYKASVFQSLAAKWLEKFDSTGTEAAAGSKLATSRLLPIATLISSRVAQILVYLGVENKVSKDTTDGTAVTTLVPLLAGAMALLTGALWMTTGGVLAPILACAVANYDLYILNPDPDLTRTSLSMETLSEKKTTVTL